MTITVYNYSYRFVSVTIFYVQKHLDFSPKNRRETLTKCLLSQLRTVLTLTDVDGVWVTVL